MFFANSEMVWEVINLIREIEFSKNTARGQALGGAAELVDGFGRCHEAGSQAIVGFA